MADYWQIRELLTDNQAGLFLSEVWLFDLEKGAIISRIAEILNYNHSDQRLICLVPGECNTFIISRIFE